jgi:glycosyltransferase involved in cell wall biosynthesis
MTQRKGLADLFAAVNLLKRTDVELVVMGSPLMPLEFYQRQCPAFRYEAPRPHAEVLALMRSCDVFALPSIVEGRALVQQEALACGLPLIVTPNAGGEDLIDEGDTGFLVPIRSPEAIAEKIAWFADQRAELPRMRQYAIDKAAKYTWERYGDRIADIVRLHSKTANHANVG